MKQARGLLIAIVVLAGLSGLVYWSNKHKKDEAAKPPTETAPKVLTLDEKQVDEIKVNKPGSDPYVVSRLGDRWEISQPEPLPADQDAVNSIVSTASTLTADRLIEEKPDSLKPYHLDQPVGEIAFHLKNGKSSTLQLGSDTPVGGATYVKLAGNPKVFSIASFSKSNLDKSLNDIRDKRLVTFEDPEKVSRLQLKNVGPEIEFGRNPQGDWEIFKPDSLRADATQVQELLRKLKEAKIQIDAGDIKPADFYDASKLATVEVTFNGGKQTVEFRHDKKKNLYAKSSAIPGIHKTGEDLTDTLKKTLADFRSKKLFDFGFNDLSLITAQDVMYGRGGEKWYLNGKQMDTSSMMTLIDKLRDLTATGFSTRAGGAKIFEASVTTRDKKRTEKVIITRSGSETFAQREGEPAVYSLDSSVADDLMKAARDVHAAPPAKTPAKK